MRYNFEPLAAEHRGSVMAIFNHYVTHGFAVYFDQPVPESFYDRMLEFTGGLPAVAARDASGRVVGFGTLRPYHPAGSFRRTAEIAYFLHHDHTRKGLGGLLLQHLLEAGRQRGIVNIIASVSSRNEPSLEFHRKQGFRESGRLLRIGNKHGQEFDIVLMQRQT